MSRGKKIEKFMIKDSVENKVARWLSFTESHKFLTRLTFEINFSPFV
jgi:hypothetical protein